MNIGMVIQFEGKLNKDRLLRAVKLSIEKIPVLKARFTIKFWGARWEEKNIDVSNIVSIVKAKESIPDNIDFFTRSFDPSTEGQVALLLVQEDKNDSLYIKISHHVSDAGGLKEYAYILADIYTRLSTDDHFQPEPVSVASRSMRNVSSDFCLLDYFKIIKRSIKDIIKNSYPVASMIIPISNLSSENLMINNRFIDEKLFSVIYEYAKKSEATINDIILAAFTMALHKIISPDVSTPLRLVTTVDFRKWYLDNSNKREKIANLSGFIYPHLGYAPGQNIQEMVTIVKKEMDILKNDYPGLGMFAVLAAPAKLLPFSWYKNIGSFLGKIGMKLNNMPPAFTNMGSIDDKLLRFDNLKVHNAWLAPPVVHAPFVIFSLSGFKKTMMLTAGFCTPGIDPDTVNHLFDHMFKYLNDL